MSADLMIPYLNDEQVSLTGSPAEPFSPGLPGKPCRYTHTHTHMTPADDPHHR